MKTEIETAAADLIAVGEKMKARFSHSLAEHLGELSLFLFELPEPESATPDECKLCAQHFGICARVLFLFGRFHQGQESHHIAERYRRAGARQN